MLGIVLAGVFELEAFGQVVVYLNCAKLPAASQSVADHKVEFRAIEGSFAKLGACVEAFFGACFNDSGFGQMSVLVATDIFLGMSRVAKRYLSFEVIEFKSLEDVENDVHHLQEFVFDLVGRAVYVGVVLRKTTHTG